MGNFITKKSKIICCLSFLIWSISTGYCFAQRAQLSLDLRINEALASSQVINITNLFTAGGKGSSLFTLLLQNENALEPAENLYFNIRLHSDKRGLIANLYQKQGRPFSLKPGQQVYATSNTLDDGLPGVKESIGFDGGFTRAGERFFNELGGSMSLPPDRYIIQIDVFQRGNSRSGGVWIVSSEAELGGNLVEEVHDIYLSSPGNALGSNAEINNPYPEFRWAGSRGIGYRLIVVEAKGQDSPQSLLQGALSTEPARGNGMGALLDYEILDVRMKRTSFQFPPSGVQTLEPGKTYYWQVLMELTTSSGLDTRASGIWQFTLAGEDSRRLVQLSGELTPVLQQLLGDARFNQLQNDGFRLQSLVIEGEVVRGTQALQKLLELKDKLDQGEISIQRD